MFGLRQNTQFLPKNAVFLQIAHFVAGAVPRGFLDDSHFDFICESRYERSIDGIVL
jgi:hypothetical protein